MFQFFGKLIYYILRYTIGLVFALLRWIFGGIISSVQARGIIRENERRRNVREQTRTMLSGLAWLRPRGKTIITGDQPHSPYRNAVAVQLAKNALREGQPVIVLHQGNLDLVNRLAAAFGENLTAIGPGNNRYDPLRGYDTGDVLDILTTDDITPGGQWTPACTTYLEGMLLVARLILRREMPLSGLLALARVSLSQLLSDVDGHTASGRITAEDGDHIRSCLSNGAAGQHTVRRHLEQLINQLRLVMVTDASLRGEDIWNAGLLARRGGVMSLDVSTVTSQASGYGLLLNDLNRAISMGATPCVILSDLPLRANDALTRFASYLPPSLGLCISSNDLLAQAGGDQAVFTSLAGNSVCKVLFRIASGQTAAQWANDLGQYERLVPSTFSGRGGSRGSPFDIFPGESRTRGTNLAPQWDPRVPAQELMNLLSGGVFITQGTEQGGTILRTELHLD